MKMSRMGSFLNVIFIDEKLNCILKIVEDEKLRIEFHSN